MTDPADVAGLPAFAALEALPALAGVRPAASVQFDRTTLEGQAAMLAQVPDGWASERAAVVRATLDRFDELDVDVESVDEETLVAASRTVRERFDDLPEARALREGFAGEMVVVPEWFRDGTAVRHGVRLVLAPPGAAPDADRLVRESARAARGSRRRYQETLGDLLGYPDCCVAFFADRGGRPPEWHSTAPLRSLVDVDALRAAEHLEAVLPDFTDRPAAFAFFAREFYPEPGCDRAVARGRRVHEVLREAAGERVADDYLRLNYLYGLRLATTVAEGGGGGRPELGDLGPEHGYLYLPFERLDVVEKYRP